MGYVIAIAGNGGTGKTTLAALLVRLIKENKLGSILAVDADPNSNLAEALGVNIKETIGSLLDEIAAHPEKVPVGMPKDAFLEYQVQTAISEGEGFDLLTMGRPEGPGCYCYVNNVLRNVVGKLMQSYQYIVLDNEAGLEHLARRTMRYADALVVVSDATLVGLKAAQRIRELVKELKIKTKKNFLVVNRFAGTWEAEKSKKVALDLDYLGDIPFDREIEKISLNGNSIMALESEAVSISALERMGEKIWQK